ncbi:MAG: DNA starvation/stationary phase protection protein Dps [Caldilineaceae bacterium]|nr:DNA starvation/stationary phase protection protein Dps [Caldilineaceae bacterium]
MTTKTNSTAISKTGTMHETSIEIPTAVREQMIALCNQQLANTADLYSQTKQAHWNVKGVHFEALHVLFDKMADSIQASADTIAERATALGGTALGTVRMAAQASDLPEFPTDVFEGLTVLRIVVERWAQYAASVRAATQQAEEAGDLGTSDLFVGISRTADKMLWFAEAHLQGN